MEIFEVLGYAIGLSADAFAVSTCKGLALKKAGLTITAIKEKEDWRSVTARKE